MNSTAQNSSRILIPLPLGKIGATQRSKQKHHHPPILSSYIINTETRRGNERDYVPRHDMTGFTSWVSDLAVGD